MREQFRLIISLFLLIIVVIFALLNTEAAEVNFFFRTARIPLVVIVIGSLIMGVIIGMIASIVTIRKERLMNRQLKSNLENSQLSYQDMTARLNTKEQEIQQLQQELEALSQPLNQPVSEATPDALN